MSIKYLFIVLSVILVLYPSSQSTGQTSARGGMLPECRVSQLVAGTCLPPSVGNRARITDGANTTDCTVGSGASINLCERTNSGTWEVPTYVGGAGDATHVNSVNTDGLDLTDNTSIAFTNVGGTPTVVTAEVVDNAITSAKLSGADAAGTSQFLRTTAGAAADIEFLTAAEVSTIVAGAASNPTALTWNVTPATCTGDGNAGALTISGTQIVCSADDGGAGGGAEWTSAATNVFLATLTNELIVGANTPVDGGKLSVNGDADQIQFIVQGHSTQTSDIFVVEDSAGTDKMIVDTTQVLMGAGVALDMATNDIQNVGTITADNIISGGTPFTQDVQCITVEDPVDADNVLFFRADAALTVTGIDCLVNAATQVVTVQECDANGGTCAATEAAITCAATNTTEAGGIDNAAIDAGDWVRLDVGAGTVGQLSVCVTFERG